MLVNISKQEARDLFDGYRYVWMSACSEIHTNSITVAITKYNRNSFDHELDYFEYGGSCMYPCGRTYFYKGGDNEWYDHHLNNTLKIIKDYLKSSNMDSGRFFSDLLVGNINPITADFASTYKNKHHWHVVLDALHILQDEYGSVITDYLESGLKHLVKTNSDLSSKLLK